MQAGLSCSNPQAFVHAPNPPGVSQSLPMQAGVSCTACVTTATSRGRLHLHAAHGVIGGAWEEATPHCVLDVRGACGATLRARRAGSSMAALPTQPIAVVAVVATGAAVAASVAAASVAVAVSLSLLLSLSLLPSLMLPSMLLSLSLLLLPSAVPSWLPRAQR
eukprot:360051-Chlamydomonas_euryale.AAC.2